MLQVSQVSPDVYSVLFRGTKREVHIDELLSILYRRYGAMCYPIMEMIRLCQRSGRTQTKHF